MTGSKGRAAIVLSSVLVAVIAGLAVSTGLVESTAPYSIYNTGGNGYSELASLVKEAIWGPGVDGAAPSSYLLIVALAHPIDNASLGFLVDWVKANGSLLVLDEHGYADPLLARLGLGIGVSSAMVYDVLSNDGSRVDPVAAVRMGNETLRIVLHGAHLLEVNETQRVRVIAWSSPLAYADIDGNGYYSFNDKSGVLPLVVEARLYGARVVVVPDLDLFSNKYIDRYDNRVFLEALAGNQSLALYMPLLNTSKSDYLKYRFQATLSSTGIDVFHLAVYSLIVLAVVVVYLYEAR